MSVPATDGTSSADHPSVAPSTSAVAEVTESGDRNGAEPANGVQAKKNEGSESDEPAQQRKLARQILFYFSDANFPYDKFLFQTSQASLSSAAQQSAPGTGWVTLTTILSFKRMRQYQSLGLKKVAQAVRDHGQHLLEVDKDGVKVKRIEPVRQLEPGEEIGRSVYAANFPDEVEFEKEKSAGHLQEELEDWFNTFGAINQVRMRRDPRSETDKDAKVRSFKGSVFCEFATKKMQQDFLALDPKPTFPGMDKPIEVTTKQAFLDTKREEKKSEPADEQNPSPKRGFNAFRELKGSKRGPKSPRKGKDEEDEPEKEAEDLTITFGGEQVSITKDGQVADPDSLPYHKDSALAFSGFGSDSLDFANVKNGLSKVKSVAFVQLEKEAKEGFVTFRESLEDSDFAKIEGLNLKICGSSEPVTWRKLTGGEEKNFHLGRANHFAKQHIDNPTSKSGGRGGGRGGRQSTRGGRGSRGGRPSNRGGRTNDRTRENRSRDHDMNGEASAKRERDADSKEEPAAKKAKTDSEV